jgi:Tfp pilus assembly protein PilF
MAKSPARRYANRRANRAGLGHGEAASSAARGPDQAQPRRGRPPADDALADRYYAMAEEMNSRGAMELAVPFYRQALALLLAEREQLRAQLPEAPEPRPQALPLDQLHGLLEAAQSWDQQQPAAGSHGTAGRAQPPAPPNPAELEAALAELQDDLSAASAHQVLAALEELEADHGTLPADGHGLRGKALLLGGQAQGAVKSFEQACQADPGRVDLQINHGGALLAADQAAAAQQALRQVYQQHYQQLEGSTKTALLRNLATAEARCGELATALHLRRQWLALDPQAEASERWLQWAQQGLADGQSEAAGQAALQLLQCLHQCRPGERPVMQALADALEARGDYRQASLLYRDLLRPQTPSTVQ